MDLFKILPIAALVATLSLKPVAVASDYGFDAGCAALDGRAFMLAVAQGGEQRAHCLAGAGFLKEARTALRDEAFYGHRNLEHALNILLGVNEVSFAALSQAAESGSGEAAFLLLASADSNPAPPLSAAARRRAVSHFAETPPWMQERYALRIVERLMQANDHHAVLTLSDALLAASDEAVSEGGAAPPGGLRDKAAMASFFRARVLESRGAWREAADLYESAAAARDDQLAAEASLRRIALLWRTGAITNDHAAFLLEQLNYEWRGGALGAKIKLALSRTYEFSERFYESILTLIPVLTSSAPPAYRAEAQTRLEQAATSYVVNHADEEDVIMLADIYAQYRLLIAPAGRYWKGDRQIARLFLYAGLPLLAAEVLGAYGPAETVAGGGAEAALDYADMLAQTGDAERAAAFLNAIDENANNPADQERIDAIRLSIAPDAEIGAWSAQTTTPHIREMLAQRAWNAGAWSAFVDIPAADRAIDGAFLKKAEQDRLAAYLAHGGRPDAATFDDTATPAEDALAVYEQEALFSAADLRTELRAADAVLRLGDFMNAQAALPPAADIAPEEPASPAAPAMN